MNDIDFENIYNTYKKTVYNVCLHYVLNSEDAQDVTQEVFVKIHQHHHKFNAETATLKTWIYRIAINHSLDFLKSKKTKKRFGFINGLFHQDSGEPLDEVVTISHPGTQSEDKEALDSLLRIIYALPENQKTAIILSKIEDRPQKEVAEIMNMSVKAIESLLQRAKQTIQKKLTDTEGL